MSRETVMLLGVFATLLIALLNYVNTKRSRFIENVSSERIKWINRLRENFAEISKMSFIQANNVVKLHSNEIDLEEFEKRDYFNELVHVAQLIELYLNPLEKVNDQLKVITNTMILYFLGKKEEYSYDVYLQMIDDIEYLQQVILKSEWKRLKIETKKGREIPDRKMKKIFIEVGFDMNEEKFDKLLSESAPNDFNYSPREK